MTIEVDEPVVEMLQASLDAGVKRLKCCNAFNYDALNQLVRDINQAFDKAAASSVNAPKGSTIL